MLIINNRSWFNMHSAMRLQCSQFSPKSSQQTPHSLPVRASYGVSVVSSKLDSFSLAVITVLCGISGNILPNYIGTSLYIGYDFKYCDNKQWQSLCVTHKELMLCRNDEILPSLDCNRHFMYSLYLVQRSNSVVFLDYQQKSHALLNISPVN